VNSKLTSKFGQQEAGSMTRLIFSSFGYERTQILVNEDLPLANTEFDRLLQIVDALFHDRPLQYILGYTWFGNLKIKVDESVLIPRPETEELVDNITRQCPFAEPVILDIGTGSGCIAISLSKALPGSSVYAFDISGKAIRMARENARLNEAHVHFFTGDILNPAFHNIPPKFSLIVSNPPYVRRSEKKDMKQNVLAYEPGRALFVDDDDPLIFYRAIRDFCLGYLEKGGLVFLEINEHLGAETVSLFKAPAFSGTVVVKDLSGKNRFIKTTKT